MALKETTQEIRELLIVLLEDLDKGALGNKTASQRVRVNTIYLEKIAKIYRKESIASEKKGKRKSRKKTKGS